MLSDGGHGLIRKRVPAWGPSDSGRSARQRLERCEIDTPMSSNLRCAKAPWPSRIPLLSLRESVRNQDEALAEPHLYGKYAPYYDPITAHGGLPALGGQGA